MSATATPEAILARLQRVFRDIFDDDSLAIRPKLTARDIDGISLCPCREAKRMCKLLRMSAGRSALGRRKKRDV